MLMLFYATGVRIFECLGIHCSCTHWFVELWGGCRRHWIHRDLSNILLKTWLICSNDSNAIPCRTCYNFWCMVPVLGASLQQQSVFFVGFSLKPEPLSRVWVLICELLAKIWPSLGKSLGWSRSARVRRSFQLSHGHHRRPRVHCHRGACSLGSVLCDWTCHLFAR